MAPRMTTSSNPNLIILLRNGSAYDVAHGFIIIDNQNLHSILLSLHLRVQDYRVRDYSALVTEIPSGVLLKGRVSESSSRHTRHSRLAGQTAHILEADNERPY